MSTRCRSTLLLLGALAVLPSAGLWAGAAAPDQGWDRGMERMMEAIRRDVRQTASYTGRKALSPRVLDAMSRVGRHHFVPESVEAFAYENRPLGIGRGQTISQPFIVALMTDLLDLEPDHRVLEIGTGSGYQAAVLGELVEEVHTIEIIPELASSAAQRLESLEYFNVHVHTGDGWYGRPDEAPFDGIMVTAVGEEVPPRLLDQLAPGGHMVLPLGPQHGGQMLTLVIKGRDGGIERRDILPVQFVPLTGDH